MRRSSESESSKEMNKTKMKNDATAKENRLNNLMKARIREAHNENI